MVLRTQTYCVPQRAHCALEAHIARAPELVQMMCTFGSLFVVVFFLLTSSCTFAHFDYFYFLYFVHLRKPLGARIMPQLVHTALFLAGLAQIISAFQVSTTRIHRRVVLASAPEFPAENDKKSTMEGLEGIMKELAPVDNTS